MALEADPKATASLRHLAQGCAQQLHELSKDEEDEEAGVGTKDFFWASRQSAEFNMWCARIGVNGEGLRSIDVRLKDVPEICELLMHLLESLKSDLNELQVQVPAEAVAEISEERDNLNDGHSDSSSLSFQSLSSSDGSNAESGINNTKSPSDRRNLRLRAHIGDTIDRLQEQARRIEHAGAQHRRKRVEVYMQKDRPRQVYEGFQKLGMWKANDTFKLASEITKERTAESFARRRIRFEYLKEHQRKKRAVDMSDVRSTHPAQCLQLESGHAQVPQMHDKKEELIAPGNLGAPYPEDMRTLFSATVNTKFDFTPESRRKERAESVRSIALANAGLPPPPRTYNGSFECPYCLLEFHAREAEKSHWSQHVMQDFEPYFCTFEGCREPFDVPNSFDGLLDHMQSHLPVRHHIDAPDGEHKEYVETEFEAHFRNHGEISDDIMATMKDTSRRKGAFLFEECPFCGGYPDVLEKRFPDPNKIDAQNELRKHVKQHMQEIALFLPPYRSDIFDEDDLKGSDVTHQQSVYEDVSGNPEDFAMVCDRDDCDCKGGIQAAESVVEEDDIAADFWSDLLSDPALYDRSGVSNAVLVNDERLQSFVMSFAVDKSLNPRIYDSWRAAISQGTGISTAISFAAASGWDNVAQYLLDLGADSETRDNNGRTPLMVAAMYGHAATVLYLGGRGANLESRDKDGRTALALAAAHGHVQTAKTLLDLKADPDTQDIDGRTPLACALENQHITIRELMTGYKSTLPSTAPQKAGCEESNPTDESPIDQGRAQRGLDAMREGAATRPLGPPEEQLASFFDASQPHGAFSDSEVEKVALLLEKTGQPAYKTPRWYIVLRTIGKLDLLESFLDDAVPGDSSLNRNEFWPKDLDEGVRAQIVKAKELVMTKSMSLELGKFCHFDRHESLPFETVSRLASGPGWTLDKIQSKISFRHYALKKELRRRLPIEARPRAILLRETRDVHHKHLEDLVGAYTDPDSLGIIMSPVANGNLQTYMQRAALDPSLRPILQTFFGCLASGLAYLHETGMRHKSINSRSILVYQNNVLMTSYFFSDDYADVGSETSSKSLRQNDLQYCSPEEARFEPGDYSSDIWSLGCVFLEMAAALKGYDEVRLRNRYRRDGASSKEYWVHPEKLRGLIQTLSGNGDEVQAGPFIWMKPMLQGDPSVRPTATEVLEVIRTGHGDGFCGECCSKAAHDPPDSLSSHSSRPTNPVNHERRLSDGLVNTKKQQYPWPKVDDRFFVDQELQARGEFAAGISRPSAPLPPRPPDEMVPLSRLFEATDKDKTGRLAESGLQAALENGGWGKFDHDTLKMMMKMSYPKSPDSIDFHNFCALCGYLSSWRNLFDSYATDGSMSYTSVNEALLTFGYRLTEKFARLLLDKFGSDDIMTFGEFVQALVGMKMLTDVFKKHDDNRDGYVTLAFEEYLAIILATQGPSQRADDYMIEDLSGSKQVPVPIMTQQDLEETPIESLQPASNEGLTATALYDYEAKEDEELSFPEGATITQVHMNQKYKDWAFGWYNDASGHFPANWVRLNYTATALYAYEAKEDEELSFPKGATITQANMDQKYKDWGFGWYNGASGQFPANYVRLDTETDTERGRRSEKERKRVPFYGRRSSF
ncbi:hypothetical protein K458DRAFT_330439 [Lentithecium fluviatile CBS 122367]|uniref:Protein kinase domain-containing protein n=1 Tax=Lentithecium fluviatile CBS 122367 TaxID=1168545 RepID=A0A6G1JHY3_9PLEO|nr:hypothetical protein K458DRAFT_330439 [Lentithecium fluviatile CBS 122367]